MCVDLKLNAVDVFVEAQIARNEYKPQKWRKRKTSVELEFNDANACIESKICLERI